MKTSRRPPDDRFCLYRVDNGGQDEHHKVRMMGEIAKLIDNADGKLITAAYDRTAKALLDQKIITKEPSGAWTAEITDKAIK
jgi:NitT/TauT family transport system substrate-binding protein